jgi:hypothetical protein
MARVLVIASCMALAVAAVASDKAPAGTCGTGNINFELGITNLCGSTTFLDGSAILAGPTHETLRITNSTTNAGALWAEDTAFTGANFGIFGTINTNSPYSYGVIGNLPLAAPGGPSAAVSGQSYSSTANGYGVWGVHLESDGAAPGVMGETSSTDANAAGVSGTINSSADYAGAVRGENFNTACCGFGVVGFHAGQGIGIGGYAPNGFGVFGWSPNNWAAYFDGAVEVVRDLHVNGVLYKGAGAFRIDNPLDPAHSYLQHSFVESPDMKNIYDGNVTTNAKGYATVTLPKWFQALNKDLRYQLTILGHAPWDTQARVWNEIKNNRFTIRTNHGNVKVSWQVTGIRHDPYANAHRIQVVVPKTGSAEGRYEHPRLYGQPASMSIDAAVGPPRRLPKLHAPARAAAPALPMQK